MTSIKAKIVLSIGVLLFLICGIFGGVSYYSSYKSLTSNVMETLQQMAVQATNVLEGRLESQFLFLETLAELDELQNPSRPLEAKFTLLDDQIKKTAFQRLSLVDMNGALKATDGKGNRRRDGSRR